MIAIYARQSLDKKDSLSIQSQIDSCIELCAQKGRTDYKVYQDKGWSAKNLNRPDFQRLNEDVKAGLIDIVCCYRIDRVSRCIKDLVNLISDYQELGAHFISVSDRIDTSEPGGIIMAALFGSMAQMEREGIISRVTDNYYYRCNMGFWGGGPAPYGYSLKRTTYDGKKHTVLEINEEEANVVRMFFDWYLEPGMSIPKILARAENMGIRTRIGKCWTSRVISDLLFKPLYAPNDMNMYNHFLRAGARMEITPEQCDGKMAVNLYGKIDKNASKHKRCRDVKNMVFTLARHSSIITSDIWLSVQAKKQASLEASSPRKGTGKASILSGLIRCGECGRSISTSGSRNGTKYYVCSTKKNYAYGLCHSHTIQQTYLDNLVISDLLEHAEQISDLYKQGPVKESADTIIRKNSIQMELGKIDAEIDNLLTACSTGNDTAIKYLNDRIASLDQRKNQLNNKLLAIDQKNLASNRRLTCINWDTLHDTMYGRDFDAKKNVCQALIKHITVYSKEHIEVQYYI